MAERSVKELFDEINSLDKWNLADLVEALEEKLGIPEMRSVRHPDVIDDRVFVSGYDVIITGWSINRLIAAKNIWFEKILPDIFPANGVVSIAKFLLDVPITVCELYPAEDALELRRKLMEAGLTVKLKGGMGYLSGYEFYEYNKHQRDQLSSLPLVPDL